jgi:hypothetical protein
MNERILELADKTVEDMPAGPWNIPDEFCEKFAELIVTECAVLINDERRAFNPTEWDQGADWGHKNAVDAITKHFGVEE